MKNGMKPCPFCGNEDIVIEKLYYKEDIFLNAYHFSVDCVCQKCRTLKNITVIGKDQEDCIEKIKEEWYKGGVIMEESERIQELKDITYTIAACGGYSSNIRVEAAKAFAMLCNIKQENAEVDE